MERSRQPLDIYDDISTSERRYLSRYGRHFNRKMYEFAVSGMEKSSNGAKMEPLTKEEFQSRMKSAGIELQYDVMCDGMFVMSMAMSDFYGTSLLNDQQLAQYVKDYVDDVDQADGFIFNRFYADCVLKGIPIDWEEML